MNCKFPG